MDTPQIALIGTEGSGKTVLTTVLAKRFSIATPDGLFLNPHGIKTMQYIEDVWNELQNGRWVPSTPAGQRFELKWSFQYKGKSSPMRLIDTAGQDLRRLYSDEGYKDINNLSEQDKKFVEYVHNSTILLVLVNLGDFIGVSDSRKKTANQAVLKEFLDSVQNKRRKIAVIFTQYDQYGPVIAQQYGDLEVFLQKELPYLYGGHILGKNIALFPLAAIDQTEIRTRADGKTERVPKRGFTSAGLDMLADWIGNAVVGEIQQIAVEKKKQQVEEVEILAKKKEEERRIEKEKKWKKTKLMFQKCCGRVAALVLIFVVGSFILHIIKTSTETIVNLKPSPEVVSAEGKWNCVIDSREVDDMDRPYVFTPWKKLEYFCAEHCCWEDVTVRNDGSSGNIRVWVEAYQNNKRVGKSPPKDEYFNKDETKVIRVWVRELPSHNNDDKKLFPKCSVP
jgi:hypothetical protein